MIDLGDGLTAELIRHQACCTTDLPFGGFSGVEVFHPSLTDPDGTTCELRAYWDEERWPHHNQVTLEALSPLTITEKLHCELCGLSGTIRSGHWVPTKKEKPSGAAPRT